VAVSTGAARWFHCLQLSSVSRYTGALEACFLRAGAVVCVAGLVDLGLYVPPEIWGSASSSSPDQTVSRKVLGRPEGAPSPYHCLTGLVVVKSSVWK